VEVVALRDDTFFGNIVTEADGRVFNIDSRPSDALALAVRVRVPIWVARSIMDTAGIIPEEDLQKNTPLKSDQQAESEEPGEERLSVFEDFLEKLDLEDDGSATGAEGEEDKPKE
jgi:bifunctional DNase/RNase